MEDPSVQLPRDETGSYLHLRLKRYPTTDALRMPYAKKTWREHPEDASVDLSPNNRSSCRQCHSTIEKGDLRVRLWLQCHKGCKNSAYFHGQDCIWQYPETKKLQLDEVVGVDKLPKKQQDYMGSEFDKLEGEDNSSAEDKEATKKREEPEEEETTSPPQAKRKKTS